MANIGNAFVHGLPSYAAWRFLAGLGLAGELGAAVTLVAEILPKNLRSYGTALVAGVGIFGTVAASLVGKYLPWRTAYLVGGGLGLVLLATRFSLRESVLFRDLGGGVTRGDFLSLFTRAERFLRYLRCILIGLPTWFVVAILITSAPELAPKIGVTGPVAAGTAVAFCYSGTTLGSFASGILTQAWGSRRKVVLLFILGTLTGVAAVLTLRGLTPAAFYALAAYLGFMSGYWAVFVTIAAEQFGTNLRSTVATTVPNFVRGSVPLITGGFSLLRGPLGSSGRLGVASSASSRVAVPHGMAETAGRDLGT